MLNPYDSHFSQLLELRSAAEPRAAGACTREGGEHAHGTSFIWGSKALSEQGRTLRVVPIAKRNPFLVKILYQELCPCTHPARAALGCMGLLWEESPANLLGGFRICGFRIYCRLTSETQSCRAASVHQNLDCSSAPTGCAPKSCHHQ